MSNHQQDGWVERQYQRDSNDDILVIEPVEETTPPPPPPPRRTIHDAIAEQAIKSPAALAVIAWDDTFTFQQLDALSTRLAHRLVTLGVGPEILVPICFERSAWSVVAMVAVLKAGGAYVPLGTEDPPERLAGMLEDLGSVPTILVSQAQLPRLSGLLGDRCILQPVSQIAIDGLPDDTPSKKNPNLPACCSPDNVAYCMFTSGSTGKPKGVLMEHAAFMSSMTEVAKALRLDSNTRFFNFTRLVADVSCLEILGALVFGGCTCIPNEGDVYGDVYAFLRAAQVTHLAVPPTYLKLLSPQRACSAPDLQAIVVASELVHGDLIEAWAPHVRFHIAYGPTETFYSAITPQLKATDNVTGLIGEPIACRYWLANTENPKVLAQEGELAEVLVEGALLFRGYLNVPDKTRSVFIENPPWGKAPQGEKPRRFFRTGDLVKRQADGKLLSCGRKDTQVKINGYRVDLGEIEHHIHQHWATRNWLVAVQKIDSSVLDSKLVAFVATGSLENDQSIVPQIQWQTLETHGPIFQETKNFLAAVLPPRMVPVFFVPVTHLPVVAANGKLSRQALVSIGERFSRQEVDSLLHAVRGHRPFLTGAAVNDLPKSEEVVPQLSDMEARLSRLWAEALGFSAETQPNDNFMALGGDSIAAMRLSVAANKQGLKLGVVDILRNPALSDMAAKAQPLPPPRNGAVDRASVGAPFSLMGGREDPSIQPIISQSAVMSGHHASDIQDIFPAISDRPYMMMQSISSPEAFVSTLTFDLPEDLDFDRFKKAWESTFEHADILRTRYIPWEQRGFVCVTFQENFVLTTHDDLDSLLSEKKKIGLGPGQSLCQFTICTPNSTDKKPKFVWTMHHAIWDGWSVSLTIDTVKQFYYGETPAPFVPFRHFVQSVLSDDREANAGIWVQKLAGGTAASFPPLVGPDGPKMAVASETEVDDISIPRNLQSDDIMTTTVIRAALGLAVAHMSDPGTQDVLFIEGWSGRDILTDYKPDRILGPTMLPGGTRTNFKAEQSVDALLQDVQINNLELSQHMSVDLPVLQAALNPFPRVALNIEHASSVAWSNELFKFVSETAHGICRVGVPLSVICHFDDTCITKIELHYDPVLIPKKTLHEFSQLYKAYISELSQPFNRGLAISDLQQRGSNEVDTLTHHQTGSTNGLPTLDFSKFTRGGETDKMAFATSLIHSFKTHGFAKFVNHGIAEQRISSLLDWSNRFFGLPLEVRKEIACIRGPHPQRGWSRVGSEQTSKLRKENIVNRNPDELTDEREHFDAGPLHDTEFPNLWPKEEEALSGFRRFMEDTYDICQNVALEIMAAMELGLNLKPGTLVERCRKTASEIRLNRYPPVAIERLADGRVKRTWPHTDFGIITLLFQDHVGGLELEDRGSPGNFVPVTPGQPNEMVINISDTFERWTNGVIPAGVHRVSAPPSLKTRTEGILPERHSVVFFFKPSRDTSAGPLPDFVTPENPARYDDITALQYQKRKTGELY